MRIWGWTVGPDPVEGVVVTTKDDHSFRGIMVDRDRMTIVLRAASKYEKQPNGAFVWSAVGEVAIPWENVSWYQVGLSAAQVLT